MYRHHRITKNMATTFAAGTLVWLAVLAGPGRAQYPDLAPIGVFTTVAMDAAFTTNAGERGSYLESGGAFLWVDESGAGGPAIGFNHFLFIEGGATASEEERAAFAAQDGIPIFANPTGGTMEFSHWEIDPPREGKPAETVKIFGEAFENGESVGVISLSGFGFSPEPQARDLVPSFTFDILPVDDPAADHIEFVDSDWDAQVVNDVADFLITQQVIDANQAQQIAAQFIPEPSSLSLGASAFGLLLAARRRRTRRIFTE